MVTVVTEAIFSYCGVKVKIDTDRHLGPEGAVVRAGGRGGRPRHHRGIRLARCCRSAASHHLTGGSKAEGRVTCAALLALCNREAVELTIDGGASVVGAGRAGRRWSTARREAADARRLRLGHHRHVRQPVARAGGRGGGGRRPHHRRASASTRRARCSAGRDTGIRIKGHRSTPGRYFRVAEPGQGWGGTRHRGSAGDPRRRGTRRRARGRGCALLMVSTTGEECAYYVLDDDLSRGQRPMPEALRPRSALIDENCEPALCTVLFIGGAGGIAARGRDAEPGAADPRGAGPARRG